MNFVTSLPLSTDWKGDSYDSILVIVNHLTKLVHYEPVKVTINALRLTEVIIDVMLQYHSFPDSITSDCGAIFTFQFWFLLYYFLSIKK